MAIKPKPRHAGRPRVDLRPSPSKRGYGSKWVKESARWLQAYPACRECGLIDVRSRMVVDHIIPHRGDMELFWRRSNWQTLCRTCHNQKTARGE